MPGLVQCVPNFSEGRRRDVVDALADAVQNTPGARLLDCSADPDHNRCVLTLVGEAQAVRAAVLAAARVAVARIDMRGHSGEHPRVGAIDVVPVTPLGETTMEECVRLSREIAADLATELKLPVYLYANSANHGHRRALPHVRMGGLERLKRHGLKGDLRPDFGPDELQPTAGAAIVGARGPLIAFNVNLQTSDISVAEEIARTIRKVRQRDLRLSGVRAIAVNLASKGLVQVSTNITQPCASSIRDLCEFVAAEAAKAGAEVAGTELIGMVRREFAADCGCEIDARQILES